MEWVRCIFDKSAFKIKHREISIAIHMSDSYKQMIRNFMTSKTFPSRLHVSFVTDNSGHYPINRLRNVAINGTTTSHFFLTDIDIWPAGMFC